MIPVNCTVANNNTSTKDNNNSSRRKQRAQPRPTKAVQMPLAAFLLTILLASKVSPAVGTIFDDYTKCRDQAQFGLPNGTLVCDPQQRLQPKAVTTLETMLLDVERNVQCDCPATECQRPDGRGPQFMALLVVLNSKQMDEDGGQETLPATMERVWTDAGMGTERCDNGILMMYIRDQRKMATYQGHGRFHLLSDQQLSDVRNNLALLTSNGTGTVVLLDDGSSFPSSSSPALAEVRRAATEDENFLGLSAIGLTIALALTFLVLVILLALLLVKCCRMCCQSAVAPRGHHKDSKYYVNPMMPSYKSIEPIYIVTPPGSEAAAFANGPGAAPPSFTSAYGTGTFGGPGGRLVMYPPGVGGPSPPPPPPAPYVQQPRSRSATPTSTHQIRRTYAPSSTRTTAQSMHSTPEAHKRDKVNRTTANGTLPPLDSTSSPEIAASTLPSTSAAAGVVHPQQQQPKKKLSQPPATIHEADVLTVGGPLSLQQPLPPPPFPPVPLLQPQFLPFLDPMRRQEVQTREQFIG